MNNSKKTDITKTCYAAYGSNMDLGQMGHRCPGAVLLGKGVIENYRLLFKGSMSGSYATIEPCPGAQVPVLLWEINQRHERALDRYEGFPVFYQKKKVEVQTESGRAESMVYVMDPSRPFGAPSEWYYDVLENAYSRFDFDMEILEGALDDSLLQAATVA